jgi:hypothetical protein
MDSEKYQFLGSYTLHPAYKYASLIFDGSIFE